MTPLERLELLEEVWGSLTSTPEALPLSEGQRTELDRRLDALERDAVPGIPWDDVLEKIRQHRG